MASADSWTPTSGYLPAWSDGAQVANDGWSPGIVWTMRGLVGGVLTYWTVSGGNNASASAPSGATDIVRVA